MPSPRLSVVIPTYNRPEGLYGCLHSLASQTTDTSQWDVIVVNDGGVDVQDTVRAFQGRMNIALLDQHNQGPASARNLGAQTSNAAWIAFLDDDCVAEPNWIEQLLKHARQGDLLGGKVMNHLTDNIFSETCQTLIDYLYERFDRSTDMFFTSNNMCIHTDDFHKIGGFDTSFRTSAGEDREFCVRAAHLGIRLRWEPEIRIGHKHQLNLPSFLRLHTKYGRAAVYFRRSLEKMEIHERTQPGIGFYLGMLLHPFRKRLTRPIVQSLLLAASQACVIAGFLYERLTSHPS